MIISKRQMQSIVEEIGGIIHHNVNIMDEEGYIIASTDLSRIGIQHNGAKRILEEHLDELIISSDVEDLGTKQGINLPIVIEKQIVGVVGITGEIEEVKMLGQVIEKMTEILILERYRSNQKKVLEDMKKSFAVEWLFGENEEHFLTSSRILNIDLELERTIVVADIDFPGVSFEIARERQEKVMDYVTKELRNEPQQLVFSMGTKAIFFMTEDELNTIENRMERLVGKLETIFHCNICCGIGLPGKGHEELRRSYREAERACEFVKIACQGKVEVYSESDVRLLLGSIPLKQRVQYIENLFKKVDKETTKDMIECLRAYVDNNGSIYKAAETLYIHKNTLQYRLNKIKQVTGYDPRVLNEAIPLYIAMMLSEFVDNK